jgi:hypothetical protein
MKRSVRSLLIAVIAVIAVVNADAQIGQFIQQAINEGINEANRLMSDHTMTCEQIDSTHKKCTITVEPKVSGGGANYGPWYDVDSLAPGGYKVESASFELVGPHPCKGDNNSRVQTDPNTPPGTWHSNGNGLLDTQWSGHQKGDGAWAACYIAERNDQRVWWRYAFQGNASHTVFGVEHIQFTPIYAPYWYTTGNDQIAEGAQLVVVYVKIEDSHPVGWPH